jgi:hypothetical protein
MAGKAKVADRNGRTESAHRAVARSVGGVAHDIISLAELQMQLFTVDARQCCRRSVLPGVLVLVAVLLALGCFPVLLLSVAELYVWLSGGQLGQGLALLLAAITGALVAGCLGLVGYLLLRQQFGLFRRSLDEFQRNVRWIKRALKQTEAQPPQHTPPM